MGLKCCDECRCEVSVLLLLSGHFIAFLTATLNRCMIEVRETPVLIEAHGSTDLSQEPSPVNAYKNRVILLA